MSNSFTLQKLVDTNQKTIIKLTGFFDGASGDESNASRISANTLNYALDANGVPLFSGLSKSNTALPYYGLSVSRIWFESNFQGTGHARLYWTAANSKTIIGISGQTTGSYNSEGNWSTIPNNAANTAGCTGDIGIQTFGANVANTTYNIIIELRKDNGYYDRGQFEDPAAFNFGQYRLRP